MSLPVISRTDSCSDADNYCYSNDKASWKFDDLTPMEAGLVRLQVRVN